MNKRGIVLLESLLFLLLLLIALNYMLPIQINVLKGETNYQDLQKLKEVFEEIIKDMEYAYKNDLIFDSEYLNLVNDFLNMIDEEKNFIVLDLMIDKRNNYSIKIENLKSTEEASHLKFQVVNGDEKIYEKNRIFVK